MECQSNGMHRQRMFLGNVDQDELDHLNNKSQFLTKLPSISPSTTRRWKKSAFVGSDFRAAVSLVLTYTFIFMIGSRSEAKTLGIFFRMSGVVSPGRQRLTTGKKYFCLINESPTVSCLVGAVRRGRVDGHAESCFDLMFLTKRSNLISNFFWRFQSTATESRTTKVWSHATERILNMLNVLISAKHIEQLRLINWGRQHRLRNYGLSLIQAITEVNTVHPAGDTKCVQKQKCELHSTNRQATFHVLGWLNI